MTVLAACGVAPHLGGCGGPGTAVAPRTSPPERAAAGVRGAESGLEILWWIVSDEGDGPASLLAPHAQRPTPLSPESQRLWRDNGIRVVSVPVDEVEALGRALRPVGPVNRQWLGERPRWTDAIRGPVSRHPLGLDLDNGPLVLDPGRLRLLLRCWVVPSLWGEDGVSPGLRVELALQHVTLDTQRDDPWRRPSLRAIPAADEEGVVFSRLTLEFVADPDHALVLVPEDPGVVWGEPGVPTPGASVSEPPRPSAGPARFGPQPASSPTLGDALLTLEDPTPVSVAGDGTAAAPKVQVTRRTSKAIVVLVPRLPRTYSLLRPAGGE